MEAFTDAEPGDVLVIDNAGRQDEACVGDLLALEAQAAGLAVVASRQRPPGDPVAGNHRTDPGRGGAQRRAEPDTGVGHQGRGQLGEGLEHGVLLDSVPSPPLSGRRGGDERCHAARPFRARTSGLPTTAPPPASGRNPPYRATAPSLPLTT
ncbi:RraA family protein [Streptomyces sp. DB-54]